MDIKGHRLVIVAAYSPCDRASEGGNLLFYNNLKKPIIIEGDPVLMGDLNAWTGGYGENRVNDNGRSLNKLCSELNLKILENHNYTRFAPNGNSTIIDYVIVKQNTELIIKDPRVIEGANCGTDHHLLVSKISFPYIDHAVRWNIDGLQNDSTKTQYNKMLVENLRAVEDGTPEQMYESIKSIIHKAASKTLEERKYFKKRIEHPRWWTTDLQLCVDRKKQAHLSLLSTRSETDRAEYKQRRDEVKEQIKRAENDFLNKVCEDQYSGNRKFKKDWNTIKNTFGRENRVSGKFRLIGMERLVGYYREPLTEVRAEFIGNECLDNGDDVLNVPVITVQEVKDALRAMKNSKAPGPGNLNIELIKAGPESLLELIVKIFNKCLHGEDPPKEWKKAIIISIYIKCRRGVSVLNSIAGLYRKILKRRIEREYKKVEKKNGFVVGRSCADAIWTLRNLIEKRIESGRELHLIFVNLQKSYTNVPLNQLWHVMKRNGISQAYITATKNLFSGSKSVVKIDNQESEEFSVSKGLRLGCSLTPLLFKIYLEETLKNWKRNCDDMSSGGQVPNILLFQEYLVIISKSRDDASSMLTNLKEQFELSGLILNIQKTKYMSIGRHDLNHLDIGTETTIKCCESFKYHGVIFYSSGKTTQDISNKIKRGKRIIHQLNSFTNISKKTKHVIYHLIFKPLITCGAETWVLSEGQKKQLRDLDLKYWNTDELPNDSIQQTIESKQLKMYGRVQHMKGYEWPKKVWESVPPEPRKKGRPPKNLRAQIKEVLRRRGLSDEGL